MLCRTVIRHWGKEEPFNLDRVSCAECSPGGVMAWAGGGENVAEEMEECVQVERMKRSRGTLGLK